MLRLSNGAEKAIKMLTDNGYEAYAVGGAIRDMLMGNEAHDFDITTSARPEEMKKVFRGERLVETGIQHGTLTLVYEGENVEITTYRIDGEYSDNRHPNNVRFTSNLENDLCRRDFTVNAIAYNPLSDTYIDLFGGIDDIKNKKIRAIGEPRERFTEDALRILRAVRFSSVLGFEIEEETHRAMIECAPLLSNISKERIACELNKLLCGKNAKNAILKSVDALAQILPEIKMMNGFDQKNSWHIYDILTHTLVALESIEPTPHLRLIAFLHDIGKVHTFFTDENGVGHFYGHNRVSADRARQFFEEYKYDTATKERVCSIIAVHDSHIEADKAFIKKRMSRMGKEQFFDLLKMQIVDNLAQNPVKVNMKHFETVKMLANEIIEAKECFSLKDLAVDGNDLLSLGFEKGKRIGQMLDYLLNEVIEGKIENNKIKLLDEAKKHLGE